jgi:hypothetical protein
MYYKIIIFIYKLKLKKLKKLTNEFKKNYQSYFYNKCMITTNKIFPNSDLKNRKELAFAYYLSILFEWNEKKENINIFDLKRIKNELDKDINFKNRIAEYYLVEAFRLSGFEILKSFSKVKNSIKIARLYNKTRKRIKTFSEIKELTKQLNEVNKELIHTISKVIKNDLKKEREQSFNKINIDTNKIMLFIGLFSTLFLLSGIINIKLFYYLLDFDTSMFFGISDYISGSIDKIIIISISLFLGIIISIYKVFQSQENIIYEEKMGIKTNYEQSHKKSFLIVSIFLLIYIVVLYFKYNIIFYSGLIFFSIFTYIEILYWIKIDKYFENHIKIHYFLLILGFYFLMTVFYVLGNVEDIKKDSYKSDYIVTLKINIENFENLELIDGNSNYLFFINKISKKIIVLPYQDAKFIEKK